MSFGQTNSKTKESECGGLHPPDKICPGGGLFPPPSRNCPGARGEGDLTEAAGSGGAPAAEAVTVAGTAGRFFSLLL